MVGHMSWASVGAAKLSNAKKPKAYAGSYWAPKTLGLENQAVHQRPPTETIRLERRDTPGRKTSRGHAQKAFAAGGGYPGKPKARGKPLASTTRVSLEFSYARAKPVAETSQVKA